MGPLFEAAAGTPSVCTAGVVKSHAGDVIITAAHCISGSGAGMRFAPGYRNSDAVFGTWIVQRAYGEPSWLADQDPDDDVAFLVVQPAGGNPSRRSVQAVVGSTRLGRIATTGEKVALQGYVNGAANAVECETVLRDVAGTPTVDCAGFAGGTSGSPWIQSHSGKKEIVGVTGGPEQGGCKTKISYSSVLPSNIGQLLKRATSSAAGDTFPAPATAC